MVKALILKLVGFLFDRKVGQKADEQKIIVAGDNNIVMIIDNK